MSVDRPSSSRRGRRPVRLALETLEPRQLLAANPIVTELMASNGNVLLDGYGDSPDWIEVYNSGDQPVDLLGYTLTDDPEQPANEAWQFPSVALDAGEYLIVFASGLDVVDPAGNLHTDFKLSASGDYLAFADPQGATITEFGSSEEEYPPLGPNASYGLAFDSTLTGVVSPSSAASYLLPSDNTDSNLK